MTPFGVLSRRARSDKGFTQRDLAKRLKVAQSFVAQVEGKAELLPTRDSLQAWADALGVRYEVALDAFRNSLLLRSQAQLGTYALTVDFENASDYSFFLDYAEEVGQPPAEVLRRVGLDVAHGRRPLAKKDTPAK